MKSERDAHEGEWDFDGSCAPKEHGGHSPLGAGQQTFSLGCFQWVRRGRLGTGEGLKKGKIMYRVKGQVSAPDEAYQKAREYCAKQNAYFAKHGIKP